MWVLKSNYMMLDMVKMYLVLFYNYIDYHLWIVWLQSSGTKLQCKHRNLNALFLLVAKLLVWHLITTFPIVLYLFYLSYLSNVLSTFTFKQADYILTQRRTNQYNVISLLEHFKQLKKVNLGITLFLWQEFVPLLYWL